MSLKCTKLLNNALNVFEQNDIHMLVLGDTRMAGFLDGCKQSSAILVPFLDTLIAGKIQEEEAAFIISAEGLNDLICTQFLQTSIFNSIIKIFNSLHQDQNNVLVTLEDPLWSQSAHPLN